MNEELKSYRPIHPGEMLREELESRGIKQKNFAPAIQLSCSMLSGILNEKRAISADVALRLEAALGIRAHIWLKLQSDYNLQTASSYKTILKRLADIRKVASLL